MTQEERRQRAEQRRAARAAQRETKQTDRALMIDALRDVLKDRTAAPSLRLFALYCLNRACGYSVVPYDLKYPNSEADTDLIDVRAKFAAALKAAEDT